MEEQKEQAGAQNQQGDNNKDKKKFDEALKLFWGTLSGAQGGKELTKKKKASTSTIDKIVEKMLQDQDKKFETELEAAITKAIEGFNKYQEERAKKLKEFEKADAQAMKEFVAVAEDLARKIQNQGEIKGRYVKSVEALGQAAVGGLGDKDDESLHQE